jgi:hypothetical protein
MTASQATAVMIFGGVLAVVGVLLLIFKRTDGANRVSALGIDFELSTPALVVLLVGCAMMVAPSIIGQKDEPDSKDDDAVIDAPWPTRIRDTAPSCVSHKKAEAMIGLRLQSHVQSCLFVRTDARSQQRATCPRQQWWICVWDEPHGRVTFRLGAGQKAVVGRASSYYVPAYPPNDRIRDPCQFLVAITRERAKVRRPRVEYEREAGQPRCR